MERKSKEEFKAEYPEYYERGDYGEHWEYHWYHRTVDNDKIPDWCPLMHGSKY
jgi:hypothetical protein